jgi:hypothetical protein
MTAGTTEPMLTLSAAVKASGVSLSTLRRHLTAGRIAGASRTESGWCIPISGLIAAGYVVRATPADGTPASKPVASPAPTSNPTGVVALDVDVLRDENTRLRTEVVRLEAEAEAQRENLADLRKALDALARALPPAPAPSEPTPTAEVNPSPPPTLPALTSNPRWSRLKAFRRIGKR